MKSFFVLLSILLSSGTCAPFENGTEVPKYFTFTFEPNANITSQSSVLPSQQVIHVADEKEAELYPNDFVYVAATHSIISPNSQVESMGIRDNYQKTEVQLKNIKVFKHPMVPISPCHDSIDGFGGSTGYSGTLGVGASLSLGVNLGTIVSEMISLSVGAGLSSSLSIAESISCTVKEGDVVQIFVEPWIVNTDYRSRTYYTATGNGKHIKSEWTAYANNDFPIAVTPAPFCHTGQDNVSCGVPPATNIFLENGAFL